MQKYTASNGRFQIIHATVGVVRAQFLSKRPVSTRQARNDRASQVLF
jgi:hypothetical protein